MDKDTMMGLKGKGKAVDNREMRMKKYGEMRMRFGTTREHHQATNMATRQG